MQPAAYLQMLLKHARMIVLLCVSAVVNVVLITYTLNEKYKASTLVLITPQAAVAVARPSREKELLNFPVAQVGVSTQTETTEKTYSALIKSRPVIERVIRALALDAPPAVSSASKIGAAYRDVKDDLKKMLAQTWQVLKYGRVVETSRFDEVANRLSEQIDVEPTRNSYVFTIDSVWTDPHLAAEIANETASAFVDLLTSLFQSEAQRSREFIEGRLEKSQTELATARQALRDFEERNGSIAFEEETTQKIRLIAKLEGQLETVQSRLSGLLNQFTAANPKVLNLQAQRDSLAKDVARRRKELEHLPDAETQLARLRLNVKTAERLYDQIVREHQDAQLREARTTSDIRVVAPALVPVGPARPIKIYYAVVALVMALMVGIGLSFAFEMTNPHLRDIEGVQQALGVPVLATVPDVEALREPGPSPRG